MSYYIKHYYNIIYIKISGNFKQKMDSAKKNIKRKYSLIFRLQVGRGIIILRDGEKCSTKHGERLSNAKDGKKNWLICSNFPNFLIATEAEEIIGKLKLLH